MIARGAAMAGLALLGLTGAAGGSAVAASTGGLGPPLRSGSVAQIVAGADGSALLFAPPGTALLAVVAGMVVREGDAIVIDGDAENAGISVTYVPVNTPTTAGRVTRGGEVGRLVSGDATSADRIPIGARATGAQATVTITVRLDDHVVEAAPLLRTAMADAESRTLSDGMARPVLGAVVTQEFGCTSLTIEPVDPACPGGHFHSGIDLAAPAGTPVQAALGGAVHVIEDRTGYGLHVVIDAGDGVVTLYAHLASALVADGDQVSTGGVIGTVGSTGNSAGPHLHFEVRRGNVTEDPRHDVVLP